MKIYKEIEWFFVGAAFVSLLVTLFVGVHPSILVFFSCMYAIYVLGVSLYNRVFDISVLVENGEDVFFCDNCHSSWWGFRDTCPVCDSSAFYILDKWYNEIETP